MTRYILCTAPVPGSWAAPGGLHVLEHDGRASTGPVVVEAARADIVGTGPIEVLARVLEQLVDSEDATSSRRDDLEGGIVARLVESMDDPPKAARRRWARWLARATRARVEHHRGRSAALLQLLADADEPWWDHPWRADRPKGPTIRERVIARIRRA